MLEIPFGGDSGGGILLWFKRDFVSVDRKGVGSDSDSLLTI